MCSFSVLQPHPRNLASTEQKQKDKQAIMASWLRLKLLVRLCVFLSFCNSLTGSSGIDGKTKLDPSSSDSESSHSGDKATAGPASDIKTCLFRSISSSPLKVKIKSLPPFSTNLNNHFSISPNPTSIISSSPM